MDASIRQAIEADATAIAGIYAPFCVDTAVSFEYEAPSSEMMASRIRSLSGRLPWLVAEIEGVVVAFTYSSPHRERAAYAWSADTSVYVASSHRRRGIGMALYESLHAVLVLQGYFKAFAGITLPNPGSVGLHEAMGYERIGIYRGVGYKHGVWHDVAWYQRTLQRERLKPPLPRHTLELLGSEALDVAVKTGLLRIR